jgi:hypothetical protein
MNACFALDDSALGIALTGTRVAFHNIDALDDDPKPVGEHFEHFPFFSPGVAGDDHHHIVLPNIH